MAYSVAQMYPGAFTPDVNFVDGKYKNSSAPGVYDGTPLDNLLFNQNLALFDALMLEANLTYNNSADIPSTSQLHKAMQIAREVSPRNNTWNGYLDPEHQLQLPAPNGYPGNSGGGEVSYTADQEISSGIRAGSGGATVASDSDGWPFTGSIYRLYDYTTAQLADIDVNTVPVYLKGQDGSEYFVNNATAGVNVTKVGGQLKVEITDAIFAELGITKLWRFFVTERVGRVVELSPDDAERRIRGGYVLLQTATNVESEFYSDGKIIVRGSASLNQQVVTNVDIGIDTAGLTILSSSVTAQDSTGGSSYRTSLASSPSLSGSNVQMVSTWSGNNIPVKFEVVLR